MKEQNSDVSDQKNARPFARYHDEILIRCIVRHWRIMCNQFSIISTPQVQIVPDILFIIEQRSWNK